MPFKRVDELSEISPLLNGFFNRPEFTADFTEADFEREYGSVYQQIFECFQQAEATMTGLAEEAFSMGPALRGLERSGVVVVFIDVLSAEFLRRLQRILVELPADYLIYIDGEDSHGEQYYVTITKQETLGYSRNPKSISGLGFGERLS